MSCTWSYLELCVISVSIQAILSMFWLDLDASMPSYKEVQGRQVNHCNTCFAQTLGSSQLPNNRERRRKGERL